MLEVGRCSTVVMMGSYTKLKHEAAEALHSYIYLPTCSISTPCDAVFCEEQTTRHDINATAHRKPSRRSASMVRDAASRCNRITGKQSNIRQRQYDNQPRASSEPSLAVRERTRSACKLAMLVPCGATSNYCAWGSLVAFGWWI
jgi:hypothetical protein